MGGNVNKNYFPGNSPFRSEKHLPKSLVLWEGSSSSMQTGHKIKVGGKGESRGWSEKWTKKIYVFVFLCFCDKERNNAVRK